MCKTLINSSLNTSSNFLKPRFAFRGFESHPLCQIFPYFIKG